MSTTPPRLLPPGPEWSEVAELASEDREKLRKLCLRYRQIGRYPLPSDVPIRVKVFVQHNLWYQPGLLCRRCNSEMQQGHIYHRGHWCYSCAPAAAEENQEIWI